MPSNQFTKGSSRVNRYLIQVKSKLRLKKAKSEEKKKLSPLIFSDSDNNSGMLRLFQLIEDTLIGLLGFIEKMLRTFYYSLIKPGKLWTAVGLPEKESPLVRPLTFLFISMLILISVEDSRLPIANSRQLEMTLKDITILEVMKFYVPVFMCSMVLVLILSYICSIRDKKHSFRTYVFISAYGLGLFYYCLSLLVYSYNDIIEFLGDFESGFYIEVLLGFAIIYFIFVRSFKSIFYHLKFFSNKVANIILRGSIILLIGVISIFITVFGSQLELEWGENIEERKIEYISFKSKTTSLEINEDNKVSVYLFIKNTGKDKIYLKKQNRNNKLRISYSDPKTKTYRYNNFDYEIEDWGTSSKNLMELALNDERWIKISFQLYSELTYDVRGLSFDLSFINNSGQERPRYLNVLQKDIDKFKTDLKRLR